MPTKEEMQSLADEIVRSYEDRISGIAELRETVKADLKEFQDSRVAMAKDLRADLAKSVADRKPAVSTQLKELDAAHQAMARQQCADLAKGRSELAGSVASKLKELDAAHQAMARQQYADLAKGRSDLTQAEAQRKSEVNAWMKDAATAHTEAQDEWQKMTATMQSKRGGVAVAVKPPIEEIAEGAAEITPETAALRGQVFEYLANHPDGTRLVELAEEFGIARIQMAKVVRKLQDENKVEKRALLYFAV